MLAQGTFRTIAWNTLGTAAIVREASGDLKLRLSSTFVTKNAPELFIYLVKYDGQKRTLWKDVGPLKRPQGGQEYDLADDVARIPGLSVAIYCAECNRIDALARLAPARGTS